MRNSLFNSISPDVKTRAVTAGRMFPSVSAVGQTFLSVIESARAGCTHPAESDSNRTGRSSKRLTLASTPAFAASMTDRNVDPTEYNAFVASRIDRNVDPTRYPRIALTPGKNACPTGIGALLLIMLMLIATGCAQDKQAKAELMEGYASLDAQQYDQAISQADAYLNAHPTGAGTAEALYLRGRGLEIKVARNPSEAKTNLQAARIAYIDALSRNPAPKLEALIHTSLANVAYFQDDYATAAQEWTIAYEKLDDESAKSWVLYRIGLCRQRQNQFSDADQIFANVQQRYPNTDPARRAKEHQGARSFTLQLATFGTAAPADSAVASLGRDGVKATKQLSAGRTVVVAGPFSSYQQALSLKARYAGTYPDAIIRP